MFSIQVTKYVSLLSSENFQMSHLESIKLNLFRIFSDRYICLYVIKTIHVKLKLNIGPTWRSKMKEGPHKFKHIRPYMYMWTHMLDINVNTIYLLKYNIL